MTRLEEHSCFVTGVNIRVHVLHERDGKGGFVCYTHGVDRKTARGLRAW
jgi:hypothetical protein